MLTPLHSEQLVADAIGRMMAFWGFRKNLGRIWAALYLSPTPLTPADLCDHLRLSTGSVSMALSELSHWGAIHKHPVAGDRRDHWVVEEDVWGTVSRVMAQREAREIEQLTEVLRCAESALEADGARATAQEDAGAAALVAFRRRRIEELEQLASAGRDLLRLVLGQEQLAGGEPCAPRPLIPRAPEE